GRIGKLVFQVFAERGKEFEVVGINDLTDTKTLAHLLKYDTVHGRWGHSVDSDEGGIIVDGRRIPVSAEKDPTKLPWGKLGVDLVIESTGVFRTKTACMKHIQAGAKRVILTVPADKEDD